MSGGEVLRLAGIVRESIVDGPGIRFTVFCQGCPHGCPGCHNPETHDFKGGSDCSVDRLMEKDIHVKGLLELTDLLIDGPFEESLRDLTLQFRGSSNQRLIDMNRTRESGDIVIWEQDTGVRH